MSERKSCNENRYLELPARQRQGGGRDDVVVVPLGPGVIGAPPMDLPISPISEMTPGRVFTFVLARWRRLQLPSTSQAPAAEEQGRTCDEGRTGRAVARCPAGMTLDDSSTDSGRLDGWGRCRSHQALTSEPLRPAQRPRTCPLVSGSPDHPGRVNSTHSRRRPVSVQSRR